EIEEAARHLELGHFIDAKEDRSLITSGHERIVHRDCGPVHLYAVSRQLDELPDEPVVHLECQFVPPQAPHDDLTEPPLAQLPSIASQPRFGRVGEYVVTPSLRTSRMPKRRIYRIAVSSRQQVAQAHQGVFAAEKDLISHASSSARKTQFPREH